MKTFFTAGTAIALVLGIAALTYGQPGGGLDIQFDTLLNAESASPGSTLKAAVKMHVGSGLHVNSNQPLDQYLIPTVLTLAPPTGFTVQQIVYPDHVLVTTGGFDEPLAVYEGTFYIGAAFAVDKSLAPGTYTIPGKLKYQACNDQQCFAPKTQDVQFDVDVSPADATPTPQNEDLFSSIAFTAGGGAPDSSPAGGEPAGTEPTPAPIPVTADGPEVLKQLDDFTVAATAAGYLSSEKFLTFIDEAETGVAAKGWFEGRGPLAIIGLILVGGLALNLTPCVLPLIPINLAIIGAGANAGSRSRGFVLGGAYGLGMTAVYGGLGLIVVLTAGSFGTINSTIWFNVAIAVLFVILGLAMFDVITIDFSRFQTKLAPDKKKKGSVTFAFAMGGVAALLAGACVAPAVIQVIVLASDLYAKGTTIALALPFVLGLGMALPWPIAGAGMSLLPKPGPWMIRVKQAIGIFIFAFAAYYAYVAWELYDQRNVDEAQVARSAEALLEEGWTPSLSQGLAMAKAENKPVLVDMWATWCKNCLSMDETTLKDAAVIHRLEGYVKVKFQAEDLEATPAKEVLKHFGGIGLPQYAILHPKPAGSE